MARFRILSSTPRTLTGITIASALVLSTLPSTIADPLSADPVPPAAGVGEPLPEDLDTLLKKLGEVSDQAQVTNEEVLTNQVALEETHASINQLQDSIAVSDRRVRQSSAAVETSKKEIRDLSITAYNGSSLDPMSAFFGATDPKSAIDRSVFLDTLRRDKQAKQARYIAALEEESAALAESKAHKEEEDRKLQELNDRQKALDTKTRELDVLKAEITSKVDRLTEEQRRAWEARNRPVEVNVEEVLAAIPQQAPAAPEQVAEAVDRVTEAPQEVVRELLPTMTPTASSSVEEEEDSADLPSSSDTHGAVAAALSKLGAPYEWGATGPNSFDCSGLMLWAYKQVGKSIPRVSQAQVSGGTPVSRANLQPGDIVGFYPGVTHVGMYIGDGKIVHASDYGIPVQVTSVDSMPFAGAARY